MSQKPSEKLLKNNEPTITQKHLTIAKILIGVTALLVTIATFSTVKLKFWPFVDWPMFAAGNPQIPQQDSRLELKVLDTTGTWHRVPSMALYTLDDDTSTQRPAELIILKTFIEEPEAWQTLRPYLVQHLEKILAVEVATVEAWELTWRVDFKVYPPLQLPHPIKMIKLGSFQAQDYFAEKFQ
ncbi:MAG: hypothetical protein HC890_18770 [Chloroflexaceae bacterium]|nr:hypothetical protein [Chloroflexaceae bacterium]